MITSKPTTKWSKEEAIFISGLNVIIIKPSQQKMDHEEKKLSLIRPRRISTLRHVSMKAEMLLESKRLEVTCS